MFLGFNPTKMLCFSVDESSQCLDASENLKNDKYYLTSTLADGVLQQVEVMTGIFICV